MLVYVLNKHGKALMPCKPGKARKLLRDKKAKIIGYEPFTIQLLYGSSGYKQPITLGIDAGSKHIGLSASTETAELFSAEIELRNDITELIATRKEYRRGRRNRKTRYRKARYENRKRKEGWLAPSVESKIHAHMRLAEQTHRLLPISKTVVEVASFDIQRIKNPEISGAEYQQGEQLNFWNVREYVLFRDGHICQHCHGKSKDPVLNVHHIESRKTGGDAPNNLLTLCETCHTEHHEGNIQLKAKRGAAFRDAAFMGIMRWALYGRLKETYNQVEITYGYLTKNTRIQNGLEKSHAIDAYCIANNIGAVRNECLQMKQMRKKKRSLHEAIARKGRKEPNVTQKRSAKNTKHIVVDGKRWCLLDKVRVNDKEGYITGFTGNMVYIQDINGKYIQTTEKYKQSSVKNLQLLSRNNNWVFGKVN